MVIKFENPEFMCTSTAIAFLKAIAHQKRRIRRGKKPDISIITDNPAYRPLRNPRIAENYLRELRAPFLEFLVRSGMRSEEEVLSAIKKAKCAMADS